MHFFKIPYFKCRIFGLLPFISLATLRMVLLSCHLRSVDASLFSFFIYLESVL